MWKWTLWAFLNYEFYLVIFYFHAISSKQNKKTVLQKNFMPKGNISIGIWVKNIVDLDRYGLWNLGARAKKNLGPL